MAERGNQHKTVFALIDCNNFFVSCERIFRPDLEGKPVVVLSSNDGCAIARSNEAKKLGIPMGAPTFKYRHTFIEHNVTQFSANFELYGDISRRITMLLATVTPRIEIYSVDESFLDLSALPIKDYAAWGRDVRSSILKNIGVPVSIGIAPSKTLAKLAAEAAKQHDKYQGTFSCMEGPAEEQARLLGSTPINKVWGVGWRLAPRLRAEGISTALALARTRPRHAQQLMGIHGRQLVAELNGTSCHKLALEGRIAQSILRSRTFGEDTNRAFVLEAAIATLSAQAAFCLRRNNLLARRIGIFTETNRHKPGYRRWVRELKLMQPTNDTGFIISSLIAKLETLYSNKQQYHRLGVFLYDVIPEQSLQIDLLGQIDPGQHDRAITRMQAIDHINHKYGKHRIYYAAEALSQTWRPKHHIRSPRYVSNWEELPKARIVSEANELL
ncbi:MAG TPA: Y-family DNA polymerase [Candidatus Saccharimonadales bacterium]|nr:Y-family DNA polymerase [Candidatus Saccharimonadales bacterium]